MNSALVGVLATGLTACAATPTYSTGSASSAVPATLRPATVPVTVAPPQPVPQVAAPPTPLPPPAAEPVQVQTTTLAPLPAATPTSGAAQSPPQQLPPPIALAPPSSQAPPPAVYRTEPARYLADGKVITPRDMYREYRVQKHDHLNAIARDLKVSPEQLIKANHLKDANHLVPGQTLKIPVEKAYEARSGDTIAVVAKRFSINAGDLASINDLSEHARLSSGEQVALPSNFHDRGAVEAEPARTVRLLPSRSYPGSPASGGAYIPSQYAIAAGKAAAPPSGGGYVPSAYAIAAGRAARARAAAGETNQAYIAPPATMAPQSTPAVSSLSDSQIVALAHGRFIWPVQGAVFSKFGPKGPGVRNDGVDISAPMGTVVHAAAPGDVVYAGDQIPGFGNLVLLQHADGWVTAYAHLQHTSVQMRQFVTQGQDIGEVGETGGVSQPQLHFEVRYKASAGEKAKPVDPQLVLPALGADAGASQR